MPCNWLDKTRAEKTCCLVCIHPADRLGQVIKLSNTEVLIGREPGCDLELADDSVSRRHALLRPTEDGFAVVDVGSTNGTYVNDVRVEMHELEPSDRLRFGNQIFKYLSADRFEAEYFEASYRMMTTDGLTEVYNKRYLYEVAEREVRRMERTGRPLAVLMIDIDRFKSINDNHGHLTGDQVLIELSQRLRANLRSDEVLARYGGEEFCLLLPDSDPGVALQIGELVRAWVEALAIPHVAGIGKTVTVSVGVATVTPGDPQPQTDLIDAADAALYAAKRRGRNAVVAHGLSDSGIAPISLAG